ncbi:MAG TPA: hypothetical protein VLA88_04255, partial [Candidatus Saccharimonadales bacterium]|nr:hypothetical protein [Candidatus Saccharimonadales bacterium]
AMVAEGIGGMEVWLNEFGAPTCGSVKVTSPEDPKWNDQGGVEPSYQNQIIQDFLNWKFQKMNVSIRLIHTLQDRKSNSLDREDCFGVYDDKGKLKTSGFRLN